MNISGYTSDLNLFACWTPLFMFDMIQNTMLVIQGQQLVICESMIYLFVWTDFSWRWETTDGGSVDYSQGTICMASYQCEKIEVLVLYGPNWLFNKLFNLVRNVTFCIHNQNSCRSCSLNHFLWCGLIPDFCVQGALCKNFSLNI